MLKTLTYCFSFVILLCGSRVLAQNQSIAAPEAVVTIVGEPVVNNNVNNDIDNNLNLENNPYMANSNTNGPPSNQQIVQSSIEPSLENGFHIRFDLESPQTIDRVMASGYMSTGISGKAKSRGTSLSERSFNLKKKINSWFPHHKKKYRPHLCGRF